MGIDRHEWEHRNYKSGRAVAAPAQLADDDDGELAVDASLGDASLQPEPSRPVAAKPAASKTKTKAVPKEAPKAPSNKASPKTGAKTTSGGKRPARAR
ncbi:hypothetical protein [Bradyrhizobium prioriisuperbiae]|uniref:hypothetical protein n=1 Tax=Bradyrhizobium prioriisuperbiae TaxID=2854389 RepID=UPI0028F0AC43|nr:hypothetical protein [Bradyrhizobium prioritasuperba]